MISLMISYYDDKDEKKAEKKLYGKHAQNLMKTDIKKPKKVMNWMLIFLDLER